MSRDDAKELKKEQSDKETCESLLIIWIKLNSVTKMRMESSSWKICSERNSMLWCNWSSSKESINLLTPVQFDWLSWIDKPWMPMMSLTCCYRWTNFGHRMLLEVTEMKSTAHALFRTSKIIKIVRETTKLQHFEILDCLRQTFFREFRDIFGDPWVKGPKLVQTSQKNFYGRRKYSFETY